MDGRMPFEGEAEDVARAATTGTLYGVGMGPGDPDLLTVKARRILERAPVLVHFCKQGKRGNARASPMRSCATPRGRWPWPIPTPPNSTRSTRTT